MKRKNWTVSAFTKPQTDCYVKMRDVYKNVLRVVCQSSRTVFEEVSEQMSHRKR